MPGRYSPIPIGYLPKLTIGYIGGSITLGSSLMQKMCERGNFPESTETFYYTVDNIHPSWRGYEIYFDEIKKVFNKSLRCEDSVCDKCYLYEKSRFSL